MDNIQILRALKSCPATAKLVLGVYPSDGLPAPPLPRPSCLVVNSKPAGHEGEHWLAIHLAANGEAYYFDSAGGEPFVPSIKHWLRENASKTICNAVQLQNDITTTCGHYCILFLILKAKGFSMEKIVEQMRLANPLVRDVVIGSFVNSHFNVKAPIFGE